ncbi:MAG: hypothetical protein LBJ76_04225 [Candidatus Accumulibacter sp.]|jgi:hypothetical protein|nr:hypothetical protein [Accumulibacter sp.]
MTINEVPSHDPADEGSLAGVMRTLFNKMLQDVHCMLPAQVVSYDRQDNTATVRPLIRVVGSSGQTMSRAPIVRVPVLALGGGKFVINFPLDPGDLGWIEASDRDISIFMQGLGDAAPNTVRLHNFSDSRFIPDIFRKYTLSDEDMADMVIMSTDGQTKIVIRQDAVLIKTPKDVTIDSGATITLNAASKITLEAVDISLNGNLSMGGGAGAAVIDSATLNITSDTTIEGRDFVGHNHSGIVPGGGNTGGVN